MKSITKLKVLSYALIVMLGMAVPTAASAQRSDDFFRNDELYGYRYYEYGFVIGTHIFGSDTDGGYNITTQQFGQTVPLGEGLLIMLCAGLGYAAMKRKVSDI